MSDVDRNAGCRWTSIFKQLFRGQRPCSAQHESDALGIVDVISCCKTAFCGCYTKGYDISDVKKLFNLSHRCLRINWFIFGYFKVTELQGNECRRASALYCHKSCNFSKYKEFHKILFCDEAENIFLRIPQNLHLRRLAAFQFHFCVLVVVITICVPVKYYTNERKLWEAFWKWNNFETTLEANNVQLKRHFLN